MKKNIIKAVCTSLSVNKDLLNNLTDLISYMDNKMQENALDILMGSVEDLLPSTEIEFNYNGSSKKNFKFLFCKYNPLKGLVKVRYEYENLTTRYFKSVEDSINKNSPSRSYSNPDFPYEVQLWVPETKEEEFSIEDWNNKSLKIY